MRVFFSEDVVKIYTRILPLVVKPIFTPRALGEEMKRFDHTRPRLPPGRTPAAYRETHR